MIANFPSLRPHEPALIEYVMLDGVNDSDAEARELSRLVAPFPSIVNLMFVFLSFFLSFVLSIRASKESQQCLQSMARMLLFLVFGGENHRVPQGSVSTWDRSHHPLAEGSGYPRCLWSTQIQQHETRRIHLTLCFVSFSPLSPSVAPSANVFKVLFTIKPSIFMLWNLDGWIVVIYCGLFQKEGCFVSFSFSLISEMKRRFNLWIRLFHAFDHLLQHLKEFGRGDDASGTKQERTACVCEER